MEKTHLLLVDDDKNISEILEFNLKNEGFDVTTAFSAEEAMKLDLNKFQLILLDVMMEGISGYKMAEKLRQQQIQVPIIFLTAKDTENDMLTGFSVGGDDYIAKPFSVKEVIARTKAVLKRSSQPKSSAKKEKNLVMGALKIDLLLKEVFLEDEKITLTKTEFELLCLLAQNPRTIFSREMFIENVWKETPFITLRTVDVHMVRLRKKLGKFSDCITSRTGYGYCFNEDAL